ncbi:MAG: hypothetical protein ABIQ05_03820 [Candidatus Limnocylindria bacterium]
MTGPTDLLSVFALLGGHLPLLLAVGWAIRVPPLSREEGHEAITRRAWDGLALTDEQQRALIRGVRAPDLGFIGILTSALPFAQRRHALRAWSGTTTAAGIRDMRGFLSDTHFRAMAIPDGPRRWAVFGKVLHCLQDSYSLAHADRVGAEIVRMKHWGPLDGMRGRASGGPRDEHAFPSDRRDSACVDGELTDEAQAAVAASRAYLEIATGHAEPGASQERQERDFAEFLDGYVAGAAEPARADR